MENLHLSPKFNKVYEAITKVDIAGSIGNGRFKTGEKVRFVVALTQIGLENKISDKIRAWKSSAGSQWVMCEDVQDNVAENFEKEILADDRNYHVFVLSMETGSDYQCDFDEARELFKTTGNIYPNIIPSQVVMGVIDRHNDRVW